MAACDLYPEGNTACDFGPSKREARDSGPNRNEAYDFGPNTLSKEIKSVSAQVRKHNNNKEG